MVVQWRKKRINSRLSTSVNSTKPKSLVIGIDIGSTWLKACACALLPDDKKEIIAASKKQIEGVSNGNITEPILVGNAIKDAIQSIEEELGGRAVDVLIALGGEHIESLRKVGQASISRGDQICSPFDIEMAKNDAEKKIPELRNKHIIHTMSVGHKIDGLSVPGNPVGIRGNKLEVRTLFVTIPHLYMDSIKRALTYANLGPASCMSGALAESIAVISKKQQRAGALLLNIGSQVTSLVVYYDGSPVLIKHLRIGGDDITKEIALALQVTLEEAEEIKLTAETSFSRRQIIEKIISTYILTICEWLNNELDSLGIKDLLPAGAFIIGEVSDNPYVIEIIKKNIKLPVKKIDTELDQRTGGQLTDPSFARAYGVTLFSSATLDQDPMLVTISKKLIDKLKNLKRFLP